MFSSAVSVGTRLKAWKMKPTRSRRSSVSCLSFSVLRSVSPMSTWPSVSVSSPAMHVHQRRLARARGAHDRRELAVGEADVDAVEGTHLGVALSVRLRRVHRACRSWCGERGPRQGGGMDECWVMSVFVMRRMEQAHPEPALRRARPPRLRQRVTASARRSRHRR